MNLKYDYALHSFYVITSKAKCRRRATGNHRQGADASDGGTLLLGVQMKTHEGLGDSFIFGNRWASRAGEEGRCFKVIRSAIKKIDGSILTTYNVPIKQESLYMGNVRRSFKRRFIEETSHKHVVTEGEPQYCKDNNLRGTHNEQ
ncbi:hypothetical protein TNCV_1295111, partial [Trichonephila clavipes]